MQQQMLRPPSSTVSLTAFLQHYLSLLMTQQSKEGQCCVAGREGLHDTPHLMTHYIA